MIATLLGKGGISGPSLLRGAALLLLTGCIASEQRGYPLYPEGDKARPPLSQVAELLGYVRYVDDVDVSARGAKFELLPGCHIVGTPSGWARMTPNREGIFVMTSRVDFALPMKAGDQYVVEIEMQSLNAGTSGVASLRAYEKDRDGNTTATFLPVSSTRDIDACQRQGAGLSPRARDGGSLGD